MTYLMKMKTFLLLLSCLACSITAGRLGLAQKQSFTNERQQFLLDVLLQVQKPLVNTELIQMGEVLVTQPEMYEEPNDVALQEFLHQASNKQVIGRNNIYNPIDIITLRQLVGLKHFFVLARDFQVFQKNVVYARLYINAVMFVDALTLAIRERKDTQDLVLPAINEILPQLYYENYILYAAQNVDFEQLVSEVTDKTTKSGRRGFFGGLFDADKYSNRRMQSVAARGRDQFGVDKHEIAAKVVVPVGQQDDSSTELANDIQLDVAWRNIVIDQLAQTATEAVEYEQQIVGISSGAQNSQYQHGVYTGIKQQQYGAYSVHANPFYGIQSQYGYGKQVYGSYGPYGQSAVEQQYQDATKYGYKGEQYDSTYTGSYVPQQYQGYERDVNGAYDSPKYQGYRKQAYDPSYTRDYGSQQYPGTQYESLNKKGSPYYTGTYGRKDTQYGAQNVDDNPFYTSGYGRQQRQEDASYGYSNLPYGYHTKNQYKTPYQSQQAYKPYGQYNNDEDLVDLNRWVRDAHKHQKGEKSSRDGESKRDSKHGENQNGNDIKSGGETEQYIATAEKLSYERRGEILLQSIQELAARLNIEQIIDAIEHKTYKQQQYSQAQSVKIAQLMQLMHTLIEQVREEHKISKSSEATLRIIADIINGRLILKKQQLPYNAQRTVLTLQQQIANIVGYPVGAVNALMPLALFYGNLREPLTQQIIIAYAELIAEYRQQLQPYTKDQLSGDIAVQNVQITPLITYTENYDADLINLLDEQLLQTNTNNLQRLNQKVVARQQRLNHEPFTVSMDIAVEQAQEVAIRVLLVPQIDYNGRHVPLTACNQNYIVMDTFVQQLKSGKNYIQRSSRQFNGYDNDATTISQLYRQVMTGKITQQQSGSVRQLPRNLLLPHGTNVNGGLPVQILVIATPSTEEYRQYLSGDVYPQQISGFGISAVGADQLPLGYPLDRQIFDEEALNIPNVQVIETAIRHDNSVRV
ncbi:fat-body protein 1-like [Eurosta solidaginis]|uniref:fat-body protein 1-like n=1 Tax=Eurosta solidaginis TaxID=178769 RepID=UPI003530F9E2